MSKLSLSTRHVPCEVTSEYTLTQKSKNLEKLGSLVISWRRIIEVLQIATSCVKYNNIRNSKVHSIFNIFLLFRDVIALLLRVESSTSICCSISATKERCRTLVIGTHASRKLIHRLISESTITFEK